MPASEQLPLPGTEIQPDTLQQILILAKKMEELHTLQNEKMRELEAITEEGKKIQEELLPDLMTQIGLTEITLQSGRKVAIKRDFFASVSKENWPKAAAWLASNKMDSIIKEQVLVDPQYKMQLAMQGLPYEIKQSIHPSTLKALVKEQCAAPDSTFPRDIFGVFETNHAVVKDP